MIFGFALSGLQEFIYDLLPETPSREARMTEGGREHDAARRLRFRSAVLSLVPSLVEWQICALDKSANRIYAGGGKLIIEAKEEAIAAVEPILRDLYLWLAERSSGHLGAYWASVNAQADSAGVASLLSAVNRAKWQAGRFDGWHKLAGSVQKPALRRSLGDREWEAEQGNRFAKAKDWKGFRVGRGDWEVGPWLVEPVGATPDIAIAGKHAAAVYVSIPTCAPTDSEGIIPFKDLAERDGEGNPRNGPYLALLRMDGDKVGRLMRRALQRDPSLAAYQNHSRLLSDFFGRAIMDLLEEKFPRAYLVYSGGDDLVACGHFDDIIRAALMIQKRFAELELDGATITAAISFFHRSSPVLQAVEAAGEGLESAKDAGGDRVSAGGCLVTWRDLERSVTESDAFAEAVGNGFINRGALNDVHRLAEPWLYVGPSDGDEATRENWNRRLRAIPHMRYIRSRRSGWKEAEWPPALKSLFESLETSEKDWPRAALVATLAAWNTKKPQEAS